MYSMLVAFALCNLLYFALHVTSSGSFPKPLSQKEERECLEKIKEGDLDAKNKLIEHNLRLVAHIIKVYYYQRQGRNCCIHHEFTSVDSVEEETIDGIISTSEAGDPYHRIMYYN